MLPLPHAFAALYAGMPDRALAMAGAVIAADPNSADAHFCTALVHLQRNDMKVAVASLQKCAAIRSGEWVLEKLRADQTRQSVAGVKPADALALGAFLRARLPAVGPALGVQYHKASGPGINVVGTSLVRSFGGSACLFPLFIGMGPTTIVLTEETLAVARRKYVENLKRLDTRRPTIIVLGAEMYYHILNQLGTRPGHESHVTEDDRAIVTAVAERYRILLNDIKAVVSGPLMLLGSTPTFDDRMNELSLDLNRQLAPLCAEMGVTLLDWWDDMADPGSNMLRADLSANAYPGDIHFTLAATGMFIDKLKALGMLDERARSDQDFEWTHVFECEIEPSEKTRIWPEPSVSPNNAFLSNKIAAAFLSGRLADLLVALLGTRAYQSVLTVNSRDAWLPIAISPQLGATCVSLTDSEANFNLGQMVLDFYGRADVRLVHQTDEAIGRLGDHAYDIMVLCLYPDTYEADLERIRQVLLSIPKAPTVVVMTPFPARLHELASLGFTSVAVAQIGIRHIPEQWHQTAVAMLM